MRRAMAAAGWVVLAAGCEQPRTELVARVDSEVAWGAGRTIQSVTITVRRGGPTGPLRSTRTTVLGTGGERRPLPLLVGIVPTDDTDTPVWIEAIGCRDPNGCTAATAVVVQRTVVRFAVGQTQEVSLLLASACVGVNCGSDERCGAGGRCEPATRATVGPFGGSDAGTMADAAMDAGSMDRLIVADAPMTDADSLVDRMDLDSDAGTLDVQRVDIPTMDFPPPVDATTPDTAASCGAMELRCGGACVAVLTDPRNCGACGIRCDDGNPCTNDGCDGRGRCSATANDTALCDDGNRCTTGDACRSGSCTRSGSLDCNDLDPCTTDRCESARGCVHDRMDAGACASSACPTGMRLIPAGMFLMGDTSTQPVHGVRLTAFCVDETEVTASAYQICVTAGACTATDTGGDCNGMVSIRGDHPINCVDWMQADAYCRWNGHAGGPRSLPTEAQWEYAARGTDGRMYPWGNNAPDSQLCWSGGGTGRRNTCPVRTFPSGNSPFGMFDMSGNVWEWTSDWDGSYVGDAGSYVLNPTGPSSGGSRMVRGNSFSNNSALDFRAAHRVNVGPSSRYGHIGFRCARSF